MSRPRNARGAPSRRALIQGMGASALPIPVAAATPDSALRVAQQWCALHTEQRRLCLAWQGVESWLFDHRDWPKLSPAEQAALLDHLATSTARFRAWRSRSEACYAGGSPLGVFALRRLSALAVRR